MKSLVRQSGFLRYSNYIKPKSERTGYLVEPWLLNVLLWDLKEIKTIVCILVSYMFGELDSLLGLKPNFYQHSNHIINNLHTES